MNISLNQSWVKINLGGPLAGLSAAEYYLKFISRFPSIVKYLYSYTVIQIIIVYCILTVCLNKTPEQFSFHNSCPQFGSIAVLLRDGRTVRLGPSWTTMGHGGSWSCEFNKKVGTILHPVEHKLTLEFISLCLWDTFSTCEKTLASKVKIINQNASVKVKLMW